MSETPTQYQADLLADGSSGRVERGFEKHTYDGKGTTDADVFGLHFDNLFDQDEDEAGSRINPATGNAYDNSTYTGTEPLTSEHDPMQRTDVSADVLPPVDEEDDEAARWLAEHDLGQVIGLRLKDASEAKDQNQDANHRVA
jgi:hypothetical protein